MFIFSTTEKKKTQIGLILGFLLNLEGYWYTRRKGKLEIKGLFTPIMFPYVPLLVLLCSVGEYTFQNPSCPKSQVPLFLCCLPICCEQLVCCHGIIYSDLSIITCLLSHKTIFLLVAQKSLAMNLPQCACRVSGPSCVGAQERNATCYGARYKISHAKIRLPCMFTTLGLAMP